MKHESTKLFRNKKGINDISILTIIIFIFFGTAILIPFINAEFDSSLTEFDEVDDVRGEVQTSAENVSSISAFSVLLNVLKLAYWDFGNSMGLPFWLDAIYTILAIVMTLIIARNVWIGGGG